MQFSSDVLTVGKFTYMLYAVWANQLICFGQVIYEFVVVSLHVVWAKLPAFVWLTSELHRITWRWLLGDKVTYGRDYAKRFKSISLEDKRISMVIYSVSKNAL